MAPHLERDRFLPDHHAAEELHLGRRHELEDLARELLADVHQEYGGLFRPREPGFLSHCPLPLFYPVLQYHRDLLGIFLDHALEPVTRVLARITPLIKQLSCGRACGKRVRHLPLNLLERGRLPCYPLYYRPHYEDEDEELYEHYRRVLYDDGYELGRDIGPLLLAYGKSRLGLGYALVKRRAYDVYGVSPFLVVAYRGLGPLGEPGNLLVCPRHIGPGLVALAVFSRLIRAVVKDRDRKPLYLAYRLHNKAFFPLFFAGFYFLPLFF